MERHNTTLHAALRVGYWREHHAVGVRWSHKPDCHYKGTYHHT